MERQEKDRVIYHIDCNAFFASVEEVFHPELKKVPMAVCGNPESRRGIILAKNQLAKDAGVKTAETIWQAKQKCPALVLRPARRDAYGMYCEQINSIYEEYTDRVERFGIDESFLDVTASLHLFGGDPVALAYRIKDRVSRETKITVSVGVSFNKIFAKLGSDMKKPDAVTVITRDNYRDVVWPLPIADLLMVGKSTERALRGMRIQTIGDIARTSEAVLKKRLGKAGEQLYIYANGLYDSPVLLTGERQPPSSVGNGITFRRNLVSQEDIETAVTALADTVATRLRKANMKCTTVQVTIKDVNLKVITRQKPMEFPCWTASELAAAAMEIIEGAWEAGKPIRMMAITGQKLVHDGEETVQMSLFTEQEQLKNRAKHEKLEQALDGIRGMFGRDSISPGSVIKNDLGIHEGPTKDE